MAERLLKSNNVGDSIYKRSTGLPNYYILNQSHSVVIPTEFKTKVKGYFERPNVHTRFKRNEFAIQSLLAIGGGAVNLLRTSLECHRVGGSTNDKINYLAGYQDNATIGKSDMTVCLSDVAADIFGRDNLGKHDVLVGEALDDVFCMRFDTYAGALFKSIGTGKKEDVAGYVYADVRQIYMDWLTNSSSELGPTEIIETAARPKMSTKAKIENNAAEGKPQGRVISMPSVYEQFLGYPIYKVATNCAKARVCKADTFICIGIKRNSEDWVKLGKMIASYNYTYEGDWSKYDQTIPRFLIDMAIDVIALLFSDKVENQNYIRNFRRWFTDNMVDKTYLVDNNVVVEVDNGIPSGSLFTSLLNSVINYLVLTDLCNLFGIKDRQIIVYGDDHLINFNSKEHFDGDLKGFFATTALERYGMLLKSDDMKLMEGEARFVFYERPIFAPGDYLIKGTRNLKAVSMERSRTRFSSFSHAKGSTHRYQYKFDGTVSFLKFHFLIDSYLPIRPLKETMSRLVNPESSPGCIGMHRASLLAAACDNRNNDHVINYISQMYWDSFDLARLCVKGGSGFDPAYSLWNRDSDYARTFESEAITTKSRVWFRRMKHLERFEDHPVWRNYMKTFLFIVQKSCTMRDKGNFEHYEVDRFQKALASKGIIVRSNRDLGRIIGKEGPISVGMNVNVASAREYDRTDIQTRVWFVLGDHSYARGLTMAKLDLVKLCLRLRLKRQQAKLDEWNPLIPIDKVMREAKRRRLLALYNSRPYDGI